MAQYVIRRLLLLIPTLFGVALLTFSMIKLAPGDPTMMMFAGVESEANADVEKIIQRLREQLLLDEPIAVQFLHYIGPFNLGPMGHEWFGGTGEDPWAGVLALDMGNEILRPSKSVVGELGERLKVTVPLALIAVLLSYILALPLGIYSAVKRGSTLDVGATIFLFVLYAVPTFWAGLMLQLIFGAAGLDLLPVIGLHDKDAADLGGFDYAVDFMKHLFLPIVCYVYGSLAYLSRQMRVGIIDTIRQDYIRTARAKGLSERVVIFKHALRNSVIPIVTLLASILPILIGGSIIIEVVFDIPGMGRYAYEGLTHREYNVIMATTLFSAFMTIVGILLSDILYAVVDPRIRYD